MIQQTTDLSMLIIHDAISVLVEYRRLQLMVVIILGGAVLKGLVTVERTRRKQTQSRAHFA
jgi:hypothetical protein